MNIINTLGLERSTEKILKPVSVEELQNILSELKQYNTTFSVYSIGKNWGYGCSAATNDTEVAISLEKLNKIIDFDKEHGLVTVEPGVSFGQLYDYLKSQSDEWIVPVTGAGPNTSVLGNAVERGYGITPITDHFSSITHLEAILPSGELYTGSLTALGQPRLDRLFKYGIGPYIDGAFTQSGLGIVTNITIKLAPRAEYIEMFYLNLESEEQLSDAVKIFKKLKKELGSNLGGVNFINTERALSMTTEFPDQKIKNGQPLTNSEILTAAKDKMLTPWLIVGAIYGKKKLVKASKKILKKSIKDLKGRRLYFNSTNRKIFRYISLKFPKLFSIDLDEIFFALDNTYNLINGIPSEMPLKLAYWKNLDKNLLSKKNLDPTSDECGLIWYAPLVEFTPKKVLEYVKFVREAAVKFNYNSLITLTTVDDVCMDSTIPIIFNKQLQLDRDNAWAFYNYLLGEGGKLGFFPYRLNVESQRDFDFAGNKILKDLLIKGRY